MTDQHVLIAQALRYAGVPDGQDAAWLSAMNRLLDLALQVSSFRFTCRVFDLSSGEDGLYIEPDHIRIEGRMAQKMLGGCSRVILFGATLGSEFDRTLERLSLQKPADALCFDALGSALIDTKTDEIQEKLAARLPQQYLTDRFSCGYGDLPLSFQNDIDHLLALRKTTGIHVLDSYMMSPTKSITALIGIANTLQPARVQGCAYCSMATSCPYKKKGTLCHV